MTEGRPPADKLLEEARRAPVAEWPQREDPSTRLDQCKFDVLSPDNIGEGAKGAVHDFRSIQARDAIPCAATNILRRCESERIVPGVRIA